jgi:hypothetical protein
MKPTATTQKRGFDMTKVELRKSFLDLMEQTPDLSDADLKRIFIEALCDHLEGRGFDLANKGKEWTDLELRAVLLDAPTKENCLKFAQAFRRSPGSIEQIYRWALTPTERVEEIRSDNKFVLQIKRVSKEIGWKA